MWLIKVLIIGYLLVKTLDFLGWLFTPSEWIPKSPEVPKAEELRQAKIARKKLSRDLDGRLILWVLDKLGAAEAMAKAEAELAQ
jgi:hypothetical protein